jgi:hypothetical protein
MPTKEERIPHCGIAGKVASGAYNLYTLLYASNNKFSRCMEHALHLGACHFIKVVSPTSGRKSHNVVKKLKKALRDADFEDQNIDFDALGADLGADHGDSDDSAASESEAAEFSVGDTIGKSLALVKQVSTVQHMQMLNC